MSPTESAVIVAVPEAETAVASWRSELDPAASWGVPAHVTVLYPFLPPDQIDQLVFEQLRRAVASVQPFDVDFAAVEWFGESVVWLAPEPASPFASLTAAVWRAFPEAPPYSGAYPDPVPHLTVGDGASPARMRKAADAVRAHLPIRASVQHVQVLCGSPTPRSWHSVAEIQLGS